MGTKGSKLPETPTTIYYESTLREDCLNSIKAKFKASNNVDLRPLTQQGQGPVVVIRDGTRDDMRKLQDWSQKLGSERLMVVMVNEVRTDEAVNSSRLVQLKWSLDFHSKQQQEAVRVILDFIRSTDPQRKPPAPTTVSFLIGQENKEELLMDAVKFVGKNCGVVLREAEKVSDTPLLLFCKTDGALTQDMREAVRKTRKGLDVMLLVVTDKADLSLSILDDHSETNGFGAKDCLLWDHEHRRFGIRDNYDALVWVQQFLEDHDLEINSSLKRKTSWRNSLTKLTTKKIVGAFYSQSPAKQGEMKQAIMFLGDHKIKVRKKDDPNTPDLLVFLSSSDQTPVKEFLDSWTKQRSDPQSALIVILSRRQHSANLPQSEGICKLLLDQDGREVLDNNENHKTADCIRNFLTKCKEHSAKMDGSQPEESEGACAWNDGT